MAKKSKSKKTQKKTKTEKKTTQKKVKKSNEKYLIFSIIAVVLVFAVLFLIIKSKTPVETAPEIKVYNGFVFEKQGNIWQTDFLVADKLKGWQRRYTFLFHYTPDEVEDIQTIRNSKGETVSPNLFLDAKTVYITTDPNYPSAVILGAVEISKVIGTIYEKEVHGATTREDPRSEAPVITCDDIGPTTRVIKLDLGNTTRIFSDHGCIVVEGENTTELLKASERLAYEMLKIL